MFLCLSDLGRLPPEALPQGFGRPRTDALSARWQREAQETIALLDALPGAVVATLLTAFAAQA